MPVQVAHSLVFKMSTTACWKAVVGTLWGRFVSWKCHLPTRREVF